MHNRKQVIQLVILISLFFLLNYGYLNSRVISFFEDSEFLKVERIIDGDTIVVENNTHIRLLGINTPEKGEKYYNEAKDFLTKLVTNKTIKVEYGNERYDKYQRTLAYLFLDEKNLNVEIVKNGLANPYIYGNDKYELDLRESWKKCISSNKNLCEKSKDVCSNCIELKELDVEEQKIIFYNKCSYNCGLTNWEIKDEGRKKFIFGGFILRSGRNVGIIVGNKTNTEDVLYWNQKDYVWTKDGDTLFLRDKNGFLVLWENY